MTVSSTTNKSQATGNGVTVAFSFPYIFFATSDLLVTLFDTTAGAAVSPAPVMGGAATYDYTVSGTYDSDKGEYTAGGTVTFTTAPPSNYRVTIERVVPQTQSLVLIDNSPFPANSVNGALDRLTVLVQRAMQLVGQALNYPSSDPSTVSNVLPAASARASMFLAFDSSGNPIASPGPVAGGSTPLSTFWATTVQLATAALSRVQLAVPGLADTNAFTGANAFTAGSITVPTAAIGTSTTAAASTAYAKQAVGQIVTTETGAVATGTTTIPADDTIPQITEGDQYMSLAITPKSATSTLIIDVTLTLATSSASPTASVMAAALFQDATANALAAAGVIPVATSGTVLIKFTHVMISGTTSATTFKVRAGFGAAGTTTFNGSAGSRLYGGVMASSIVIREVLP